MSFIEWQKEGQRVTSLNHTNSIHNQAVNQVFNGTVNFPLSDQYAKFNSSESSARNDDDILRSLAFPEMFARKDNMPQHYRSTCEWILDLNEYKTWVKAPRGLLWIKGKPGAGKSTLMTFLYERLKNQYPKEQRGIVLEFFFYARGVDMQRTPLGMLRSLLNQLFRQDETIRFLVREPYNEKCAAFGNGKCNWEWQQRELEKLLQKAILLSAQQQVITIFVDALDAAGPQFATEIATYLHLVSESLIAEGTSGKICISCRHYPVPTCRPGVEVCVENHNRNDIATYICGRLAQGYVMAAAGTHGQWWYDLQAEVIDRAKGVFQWAHLIVSLILEKVADGRSPQDVRYCVQEVPNELGAVYAYILENVIKREYYNRSFILFQRVCLAERPLSVREMGYALAARITVERPELRQSYDADDFKKTDEHLKQQIKALSGGLVEVMELQDNENREIIQVIHQSIIGFLRMQGLGLLATLVGDKGDDLDAARHCTTHA